MHLLYSINFYKKMEGNIQSSNIRSENKMYILRKTFWFNFYFWIGCTIIELENKQKLPCPDCLLNMQQCSTSEYFILLREIVINLWDRSAWCIYIQTKTLIFWWCLFRWTTLITIYICIFWHDVYFLKGNGKLWALFAGEFSSTNKNLAKRIIPEFKWFALTIVIIPGVSRNPPMEVVVTEFCFGKTLYY